VLPTLLRQLLWTLGSLLGAALVALCALHQAQLLQHSWEVAAIAISPWALLLALPLGIAALAGHRRLLAAACAGVLACWCVWGLPDFWPLPRVGTGTGPALVRVFDANVSQSSTNLASIAGEIRRDHPDVIAFQELTPVNLASIQRTGVLRRFRWRLVLPRSGAAGVGFWSSLPTTNLRSWPNLGDQEEILATLHPRRGPSIRFALVHVYAPVFGVDEPWRWRAQLTRVRTQLAHLRHPLLVAGDFNATWDLRPFQAILRLGLADAAVERGDGWRMTWPSNQQPVPSYLRIDHVLLSPALVVRHYKVGAGTGSDHRTLFVTVGAR